MKTNDRPHLFKQQVYCKQLKVLVSGLMAITLLAGFGRSAVAENPQESKLQLEEVLVTSRKREESIQDVPIAVTAITEDLENPSIRNLRDLEGLAPNVQIRHSMGRTAPVTRSLSAVSGTATTKKALILQ